MTWTGNSVCGVNTVGYQSIPPDSPYPLKEHSVSKKQDFLK